MQNTKEINGNTYLIGEMNAFAQLHVARRLAPVLASLVTSFKDAPALASGESAEDKMLDLATGPIAESLSKMTDSDVDYIVNACLAVCQRQRAQKTGYDKVMSGGTLMFQDIKVDTLMGLTVAVIQENLGSFFPTSQPASAATN